MVKEGEVLQYNVHVRTNNKKKSVGSKGGIRRDKLCPKDPLEYRAS